MKQAIKAIFFDIDSTIYYHAIHDILPGTQQAMVTLRERGIKVGVATSRCQAEMQNTPPFFRHYPFAGMVSDGGALVKDAGKIVQVERIDPRIVQELIDYAQAHHYTLRYSTVNGNYFHGDPTQKAKDSAFALYLNVPFIKPYDEQDEVLNMIMYVNGEAECAALCRQFADRLSMVNYHSAVEFSPCGIDKSKGIAVLAKRWQLTMDEVMCFGDGRNDVKMLKACGIGIAMGNGCDAVKAAADFVTKRIEDDGIAFALQQYGLI